MLELVAFARLFVFRVEKQEHIARQLSTGSRAIFGRELYGIDVFVGSQESCFLVGKLVIINSLSTKLLVAETHQGEVFAELIWLDKVQFGTESFRFVRKKPFIFVNFDIKMCVHKVVELVDFANFNF